MQRSNAPSDDCADTDLDITTAMAQSFPSTHFSQYHSDARPAAPPADILGWYALYQSCHRHFLEKAQHHGSVQAVAAFMNIQLPFQKLPYTASANSPRGGTPAVHPHPASISLLPYIRRLVVTGQDTPPVLHWFFGDDWRGGIGELHEQERRNYMFAAKSTSWLEVKRMYDMSDNETAPCLRSLANATEKEIQAAEAGWSEFLAMQDWMIGPRAPDSINPKSPRVKREPN